MPCQLNKAAYEQLIKEDVEWLRQQPRTLERHHIEQVLLSSVDCYYPPRAYQDADPYAINELERMQTGSEQAGLCPPLQGR